MKYISLGMKSHCDASSVDQYAVLHSANQAIVDLLEMLVFRGHVDTFSAAFLNYVLKWLEDSGIYTSLAYHWHIFFTYQISTSQPHCQVSILSFSNVVDR